MFLEFSEAVVHPPILPVGNKFCNILPLIEQKGPLVEDPVLGSEALFVSDFVLQLLQRSLFLSVVLNRLENTLQLGIDCSVHLQAEQMASREMLEAFHDQLLSLSLILAFDLKFDIPESPRLFGVCFEACECSHLDIQLVFSLLLARHLLLTFKDAAHFLHECNSLHDFEGDQLILLVAF